MIYRIAATSILVVVATTVGQTTTQPGATTASGGTLFRLRPVVICDTFPGGYQVAVADMNGDHRPDILALGEEPGGVEWFENPGRPETPWARHAIARGQTRRNIDLAAYDVDRDGRLDVAIASDFDLGNSEAGGTVSLFRHVSRGVGVSPASNENKQEWQAVKIHAEPTAHRIRWPDVDGDGRKELIAVPILGKGAKAPSYQQAPARITCHWIPADPAHDEWAGEVLDASLTVVHGVFVTDWDGDGRDEVLTASNQGIHLFRAEGKGPGLRWSKRRLAAGHQSQPPNCGSSEVCVGRGPGGRFLAAAEPWHGNEVVVYSRKAGGDGSEEWQRLVIDDSLRSGHALCCVDLDGDGNDEIVAGYRGEGTSLYGYCMKRAKAGETPAPQEGRPARWERFTIDAGGIAAQGCVAADMNADGRPDVIAAGGTTHNVKLYLNEPR